MTVGKKTTNRELMSHKKQTRRATPINPLAPIKLRLRETIEQLGLNDAMEAGVDLPDESELFAFGVGRHCQWLEDNAKQKTRKQLIALARLFRLYPSEVRVIIETLHYHGIVEDEPVQYAMAELIFRCLAAMPEYKTGIDHLHDVLYSGDEHFEGGRVC
jgi:hypothetical protein